MTPRSLLIRTAGTNCEAELEYAWQRAGAATEILHIKRVLEAPALLRDFQLLSFPGGFSYGDDLGAGRIHAIEIRERLIEPLREFVNAGKLVYGVCNGFQVLVKTGLLPGFDFLKPGPAPALEATLTDNERGRFQDRWITVRAVSSRSPFVAEGAVFRMPIAHGEGKFLPKDDGVLAKLRANGQIVLTYVKPDGSPAAGWPDNPNGSVADIAGICDPTGRIFGLMPHPERFVDRVQGPTWTREEGTGEDGEGLGIFRNAVAHVRGA
ncbi:MAG: phosphoribosylformylglycinamidine synthase I [Candidatus Brocadiae bacterium]|nr:phosphoribosylformylglycinamidine synthase I [Candidatus Brocadiia bacterium]